jgi:hypothetical protein
VHGLRGRPSNRKITEKIERRAVQILSMPVYAGFGPTLAAEYLEEGKARDHREQGDGAAVDDAGQTMAGKETEGGASAPVSGAAEPVWRVGAMGHQRARLAGRTGRELYLIAMIDDATSRLLAASCGTIRPRRTCAYCGAMWRSSVGR